MYQTLGRKINKLVDKISRTFGMIFATLLCNVIRISRICRLIIILNCSDLFVSNWLVLYSPNQISFSDKHLSDDRFLNICQIFDTICEQQKVGGKNEDSSNYSYNASYNACFIRHAGCSYKKAKNQKQDRIIAHHHLTSPAGKFTLYPNRPGGFILYLYPTTSSVFRTIFLLSFSAPDIPNIIYLAIKAKVYVDDICNITV